MRGDVKKEKKECICLTKGNICVPWLYHTNQSPVRFQLVQDEIEHHTFLFFIGKRTMIIQVTKPST
jgi:hypothetical protein